MGNKTGQAAGSRMLARFYMALIAVMALSGFGQMPIYKRYYLADIPGLTWMADFYATHALHYVGASVLFFIFAYCVTGFFLGGGKHFALTKSGWARVLLLAGIAVTGVFRVAKNMPQVTFSPNFTMFIDFAHLILAMTFLFASLGFVIARARWAKSVSGP